MKYSITKEDFLIASEFAKESHQLHSSHGRTDKQVIHDIIVGKLGEIAYKKILGDEIGNMDLSIHEDPDPGWDFEAKNGDRIQIKTVQPNYQWVTFGNYYWERLVIMQIEGNECTLLRDMHITEVKQLAEKSKFKGWYIPSYKI
jgi:hypothetical protein